MLPSITILGRNVPTYGLCAALGLMLFVLLFKREDKHCPGESADVELGFVYGLLGAALGAKLLFLLTGLPALWADRALLFSDTARFLETYVLSGFVFYGGLYGALCGVLLYGKKAGASGSMLLRRLLPGFALVHAFGRAGCFLTGCCYGLPHPRLGISFSRSLIAPNGVPLLPVQLYGAGLELLLFICLYRGCRRKSDGYRLLGFLSVSLWSGPFRAGISPWRRLPGLLGTVLHLSVDLPAYGVSGDISAGAGRKAGSSLRAATPEKLISPFHISHRKCFLQCSDAHESAGSKRLPF